MGEYVHVYVAEYILVYMEEYFRVWESMWESTKIHTCMCTYLRTRESRYMRI